MMGASLRTFWTLSAAGSPPRRTRWDWVWVALCIATTIGDLVFGERPTIATVSLRLAIMGLLIVALLVRRTHRRVAVALTVLQMLLDFWLAGLGADFSLAGGTYNYVLIYSIVRWGSGREIVALLVSVTPLILISARMTDQATVIAAVIIEIIAVGVGLVRRQYARLAEQELHQARLAERQQLARELHDSVAHHVSAIAVQARAAEALVGRDAHAAAAAMQLISGSATDALKEMRYMVSALRDDDSINLHPAAGLSDIVALERRHQASPRVEVELSGLLDRLEPAVEAGLFRIAQESVTNASRHARHAHRVQVIVTGRETDVELVVIDDGEPATLSSGRPAGYGITGMRERVAILGGTFSAGPERNGGWRVEAVIPRRVYVSSEASS